MKYNDKYPNAEKFFSPVHSTMMKGSILTPCWHCSELTDWIDYCFEAHLCSEECYDAKWTEYMLASNNVKLQCKICGRTPDQISEYQNYGYANNMTPNRYVWQEEGTLNKETGLFYCTDCYIKIGQPKGKA